MVALLVFKRLCGAVKINRFFQLMIKTLHLWDHASIAQVKSLNFNLSVSHTEHIPERGILVMTCDLLILMIQ